MCHHRDPLIGPRGASIGVGRGHHRIGAALRHRHNLSLQKLALGSGLIRMRHRVLRREIPALNRALYKIDPRRQDEFVIGQRGSTRQAYHFFISINANGPIMHDIDATGRKLAIGMADIIKCLYPAQIKIREKAGVISSGWLNQSHINCAFAIFCNITRCGGAASSAAHHEHTWLCMAACVQTGCRKKRSCRC